MSFPWTPWLHTRKRVAEIFVCVEHDHGAASQSIAHVSKNGDGFRVLTSCGDTCWPYAVSTAVKRRTSSRRMTSAHCKPDTFQDKPKRDLLHERPAVHLFLASPVVPPCVVSAGSEPRLFPAGKPGAGSSTFTGALVRSLRAVQTSEVRSMFVVRFTPWSNALLAGSPLGCIP